MIEGRLQLDQIQFHLHLAFSLLTESISGPCLSVSVSGALTEFNNNKFPNTTALCCSD